MLRPRHRGLVRLHSYPVCIRSMQASSSADSCVSLAPVVPYVTSGRPGAAAPPTPLLPTSRRGHTSRRRAHGRRGAADRRRFSGQSATSRRRPRSANLTTGAVTSAPRRSRGRHRDATWRCGGRTAPRPVPARCGRARCAGPLHESVTLSTRPHGVTGAPARSTTSTISVPQRWKPWRMVSTSRTRFSGAPVTSATAPHVRARSSVVMTT